MRYFNEKWDELNFATILPEFIENVTEEAVFYNEDFFNKQYNEYTMRYTCYNDNPEKKSEFLHNNFRQLLDTITQSLPENIKVQIPDIRMLALGVASQETYNMICSYAKEAKSSIEQLEKAYERDKKNAKKYMSDISYETINNGYHDGFILDVGYEASNLYMKLRMDGHSDNLEEQYRKIIFQNAILVKGNIQSKLYRWKNHEIYYENDKIEIHIRFSYEDVIIRASDIYSESYLSYFVSDDPLVEKLNDEVFRGTVKELIEAGYETRENTLEHPLRKKLGDTKFENMEIIRTKDMNSFGKLEVVEKVNHEILKELTCKNYIYQIKFGNTWSRNPDVWLRGGELIDYIKDNCNNKLELWSVWSDCYEGIETRYIQLRNLCESDLESIYHENIEGIVKSRRLIIYK